MHVYSAFFGLKFAELGEGRSEMGRDKINVYNIDTYNIDL